MMASQPLKLFYAISPIFVTHAGDLEEYGTEVVVLSDHGSHPNIVAFYGAFYHEDTLWVMLELCMGMTCCARTN
jgi:serine/threonine protein kinase